MRGKHGKLVDELERAMTLGAAVAPILPEASADRPVLLLQRIHVQVAPFLHPTLVDIRAQVRTSLRQVVFATARKLVHVIHSVLQNRKPARVREQNTKRSWCEGIPRAGSA